MKLKASYSAYYKLPRMEQFKYWFSINTYDDGLTYEWEARNSDDTDKNEAAVYKTGYSETVASAEQAAYQACAELALSRNELF